MISTKLFNLFILLSNISIELIRVWGGCPGVYGNAKLINILKDAMDHERLQTGKKQFKKKS